MRRKFWYFVTELSSRRGIKKKNMQETCFVVYTLSLVNILLVVYGQYHLGLTSGNGPVSLFQKSFLHPLALSAYFREASCVHCLPENFRGKDSDISRCWNYEQFQPGTNSFLMYIRI